jgi:glycosyltransferase involved in cell wall biosynthesis
MPLFSVIIPTYNSGWSLQPAIESVLSQTFHDFEIIVVDDGSTDDTQLRLQRFTDPRLKFIYKKNAGRAEARNSGIAVATGDWLAFLDADDLWLPCKLEKQALAIQGNPEIVMVYSKSYSFSERDMESGVISQVPTEFITGEGRPHPSDCLREFLLARFHVCTSTVAANRMTVVELDGFDPQFKISEDWDLFTRLAWKGKVLFIPEPLGLYWLGFFKTSYERGTRYGGHQEALIQIKKNLTLTKIDQTDPEFARHALALWQWRYALVERGIGNIDNAREHFQYAFEYQTDLLKDQEILKELSYFLFNVLGWNVKMDLLKEELTAIFNDMSLGEKEAQPIYWKVLAYCYSSLAFRFYSRGEVSRGLTNAFSAIRLNPALINNRGLWLIGLKLLLHSNSNSIGLGSCN